MDALVRSLLRGAIDGDAKAAATLLDRLLGKVPQPITGDEGGPLKIVVEYEGKTFGASLPASGPDGDSF